MARETHMQWSVRDTLKHTYTRIQGHLRPDLSPIEKIIKNVAQNNIVCVCAWEGSPRASLIT